MINTLKDFTEIWTANLENAKHIHESFCQYLELDEWLVNHRQYCQDHVIGFGERSFHYLWKLIIDEMPSTFSFLEIGVHRGQVLGLIGGLAKRTNREVKVVGVSPFDGTEINIFRDYEAEVRDFYKYSTGNDKVTLIRGFSQEIETIAKVKEEGLFNVVYVDGGHSEVIAKSDIHNYAPLVKVGGYLVIDDCANKFNMPFGYFCGIESVSKAVDELLPPFTTNDAWKHLGNVVHNRIWQRVY